MPTSGPPSTSPASTRSTRTSSWAPRGGVQRTLRGILSATFGQSTTRRRPDGAGGQTYDGRTDRYWGFSVGADWWTRQHFSVGAAYSYMRRDGDVDGSAENQTAASYENRRWTWRASWNY
jgi:hypothetical protein